MHIKRKALYNLLRMNWQRDPTLPVEPWQVEDYRALTEQQLFSRLQQLDVHLDKQSFLLYAEQADCPEMLVELLYDEEEDLELQDQVYLLIFELWRSLVHDKTCLSIFCDELDFQINSYDRGEIENPEAIEDILARLEALLDEYADQGVDPVEIFESLAVDCANDIETFLYDFISEQLDNGNETYASDLIEGFYDYVREVCWFDFLKGRLATLQDRDDSSDIIKQLIEEVSDRSNPDFNFELLAFLSQGQHYPFFIPLVKKMIPLLQNEEDFQDLLTLSMEFCQYLSHYAEEEQIQHLLIQRSNRDPELPLDPQDVHKIQFIKILEKSFPLSLNP